MKGLVCSLAAALCLPLGSGALATVDKPVEVPGKNIVIGTVVSVDKNGFMEISGFGEVRTHANDKDSGTGWAVNLYRPKVGEKVKVYYHLCGRLGLCADKIEKVSSVEGRSKER